MCGIVLVTKYDNAIRLCLSILQRLQHRGHQGAKIVYGDLSNPKYIESHGGRGNIDTVFSDFSGTGNWCIGHTRYTTHSERVNIGKTSRVEDLQPFVIDTIMGKVILAHNGQLGGSTYEYEQEKEKYMQNGYSFHTESDSELLLAEISSLQSADIPFSEIISTAVSNVKGSASIVGCLIDPNQNISYFACRKQGNRPLFMGKIDNNYVFSSEDYMLKENGIKHIQEIPHSTMVYIDYSGIIESYLIGNGPKYCIFELFYFSYPLTTFLGVNISKIRKYFGQALYHEYAQFLTSADIVIGVPDSGNHAALGLSHASGIPLDFGILRNHYIGRSFIAEKSERLARAENKYMIDESVVKGKDIIVVDDSLVRSITAKVLSKKLRKCGVNSITFLVASPPIKYCNYYGIDIQNDGDIAAANMTIKELRDSIGFDRLFYLPLDTAINVIKDQTGTDLSKQDFCTCCFTGDYWHN